MLLYQYLVIHVSFALYLVTRIICKIAQNRSLMHEKPTLTSIPEHDEPKWVPKKKHEVLKAKYKCLKKLFQIYDASVIGILPETVIPEPVEESRRKRSYRTKTDACAGTENPSDATQSDDGITIATEVIKELKLNVSTPNLEKPKDLRNKSTQDLKDITIFNDKYEILNIPPLHANRKRRPTRFQSFIQRLLGLSHEPYQDKVYAVSDNNISNRFEKRRRGLQFRRLRRLKKIHSEIVVREKNPVLLSCVQSIQRSCLLDTTPRQCPILGCQMIFYGIINYNDHLNLCHFTYKKYVCHYCHEGFIREHEKIVHENEHIGITKLNTKIEPACERSFKITNDTQTEGAASKTDLPEEKLKKIVSFFDKIQESEEIIAEIKRSRISEAHLKKPNSNVLTDLDTSKTYSDISKTNLDTSKTNSDISKTNLDTSKTKSDTSRTSDKTTTSCINLTPRNKTFRADITNSGLPVKCRICGEKFDYRRQLSLHVDLEHRVHDKFSKFHSCAGIINSEKSKDSTNTTESSRTDLVPSASIVYYTSTETLSKKSSVVDNLVQKVRSGFCYKWEAGTKIIRV